MKMQINIEGCPYEDKNELNIIFHASDMYLAIFDAIQAIRCRLKYDQVTGGEQEEIFLENLREILCVDGIEL
jgi:hypothetical protein